MEQLPSSLMAPRPSCPVPPKPSSPISSVSSSPVALAIRASQPAPCTCRICGRTFRNIYALAGHHNAHGTGKISQRKRAAMDALRLLRDNPSMLALPPALALEPLKATCIYKPRQGYRRGIASGFPHHVRSLPRYTFPPSVRSIVRSDLPRAKKPQTLPPQNPRNSTQNESLPSLGPNPTPLNPIHRSSSVSLAEQNQAGLRSRLPPLPPHPLDVLKLLKEKKVLGAPDEYRSATARYLVNNYMEALQKRRRLAQALVLRDNPTNTNRETVSPHVVAGSSGGSQNNNPNLSSETTSQIRMGSTNLVLVPKEEVNQMDLDLNLHL